VRLLTEEAEAEAGLVVRHALCPKGEIHRVDPKYAS
jgi:hypothetical protein